MVAVVRVMPKEIALGNFAALEQREQTDAVDVLARLQRQASEVEDGRIKIGVLEGVKILGLNFGFR